MNAKQSAQDGAEQAKKKVGEVVDQAFGAGTTTTVEGKVDQVLGQAQARVGHAVGYPAMEVKGTGREVHGKVEQAQGRVEHDFAALQANTEKEVSTLRAQMADLKSKAASTTGEAKAKAQAQLDATKAKMQAAETRIKEAIEEAKAERDARIAPLQQEAAHATGEARAKIEARITQVKSDFNGQIDKLKQTLEHIKQTMAG